MRRKIFKLVTLSVLGVPVIVIAAGLLAANKNYGKKDHTFASFIDQFAAKKNKVIRNNIELLFVQHGRYASLHRINSKTNCLELQVWPLGETVHYFSDVPVRVSGNLTSRQFVAMWDHQSEVNGKPFIPNVAIEAVKLNKQGVVISVFNQSAALSDALYHAKDDSMSYMACPIKGSKLTAQNKLQHVIIFFDNFGVSPFQPWPPSG